MNLPDTKNKQISYEQICDVKDALRQMSYTWAKQLAKKMYGKENNKNVQKIQNIVSNNNRNNEFRVAFINHGLDLLKELIEKSESAKLSIEMQKDEQCLSRLHSRGVIPEECYKTIEDKIKKVK